MTPPAASPPTPAEPPYRRYSGGTPHPLRPPPEQFWRRELDAYVGAELDDPAPVPAVSRVIGTCSACEQSHAGPCQQPRGSDDEREDGRE